MTNPYDALFAPPRPTAPVNFDTTGRDLTAYAQAALDGEVANVLAVPIGSGRNHALNISAMKLGQLVGAGQLTEQTVIDALGAADGGIDNHPATRPTIMSGLRAGIAQGRQIPDNEKDVNSWLDTLAHRPSPSAADSRTPVSPSASQSYTTTQTPDGSPDSPPSASLSTSTTTSRPADQWSHQSSSPPSPDSPPASSATSPSTHPDTDTGDLVRQHLPIINWHHLWADDTTEEWIIEPLLPARRLVALYSPPKIGKSLLMLELAVAIARGIPVLGTRIDRARRILYVDYENDPIGDIRSRLRNMHLNPDQLDNLCYLSFPALATLDTPRGADQLMAAVDTYQCEVVVIDTVSRAVAGDENENDTWLDFYRETGLKLKRAGVALIRLDHTGKSEDKGMRGGSAKSGDVDAVWKMRRSTPDTFVLTCEANRFPIAEADKFITITRVDNPLHHKVEPTGAAGIIRDAAAEWLDLNTAWDRPYREVYTALNDAGIKISQHKVRDLLASAEKTILTQESGI